MRIEGGCLCGACRYASDDAPLNVRACHCRICQKATGGPFYARVQVPLAGTTISGPVGWFTSSPGVRRGFCRDCGTSLFTERADNGLIGLTMGSLDDPDQFQPVSHIFMSSKQVWLVLGDDLPKYDEMPPA